LIGIVLLAVLFFWLLAAMLSPDRGRAAGQTVAAGDVDRLRELSELHTAGSLTDEEFSAAKRKLLGLQ
jgi:uncharacterized membrane protein